MKSKLKMILGGILCVISVIVLADGIVYCPNKLPTGQSITSLKLDGKPGYILEYTFLPVDNGNTSYSFLKAEIPKDTKGVLLPQCWYKSSDPTKPIVFFSTLKDLKLKPSDNSKFKDGTCDASNMDCAFTPSQDL